MISQKRKGEKEKKEEKEFDFGRRRTHCNMSDVAPVRMAAAAAAGEGVTAVDDACGG